MRVARSKVVALQSIDRWRPVWLFGLLVATALAVAGCDGLTTEEADGSSETASEAAAVDERSADEEAASVSGSEDGPSDADRDEDGSDASSGADGATTGDSDGQDEGADARGASGESSDGESSTSGDDGSMGASSTSDDPPAPADPLTAAEADRALALALGAESVSSVVASAVDRDALLTASTDTELDAASIEERVRAMAEQPSYRVVYSQRFPSKDPNERAAEVAMYRYDTGEAIFRKVDLASGDVTALDVPDDAPVPLVPEEIEEAAIVARNSAAARERMESEGLDPDTAVANALLTGTEDASSPCAQHRCVRLFFSNIRRPVPEFSVVVDMVTLEVVDIADMPGRSLNE